MGHGVLNDERLEALRMSQRQPESHRTAVILQIERIPLKTERFREMLHHLGDMIKRIGEVLGVRRIAVAEPGIVRRDQMEVSGQPGQQRLIHARG
jgi:hypothetical protein